MLKVSGFQANIAGWKLNYSEYIKNGEIFMDAREKKIIQEAIASQIKGTETIESLTGNTVYGHRSMHLTQMFRFGVASDSQRWKLGMTSGSGGDYTVGA